MKYRVNFVWDIEDSEMDWFDIELNSEEELHKYIKTWLLHRKLNMDNFVNYKTIK